MSKEQPPLDPIEPKPLGDTPRKPMAQVGGPPALDTDREPRSTTADDPMSTLGRGGSEDPKKPVTSGREMPEDPDDLERP